MENQTNICQSCGIPLDKDPNKGGTNADNTRSNKFCSFCFDKGKFRDEGKTLNDKIDKIVRMAVEKMNMPEDKAREIAESILPKLVRWKNS